MKFSVLAALIGASCAAPALAAPTAEAPTVAAPTVAAPTAEAPTVAASAANVPAFAGDAALFEVAQLKTVWRDPSRQREVPVKIFYPQNGGPFPLIVLSHGLGGSRDGLDYLGRYWAQHGYVCAQIQHVGTDESVWRGAQSEAQAEAAMKRAGGNLMNIVQRPRDVSFAIDQMLKLGADANSELKGKINPDAIGIAGHSLGGLTALLSAGQEAIGGGMSLDLSDPRIRASVAMSSPLNPAAPVDQQFAGFKIPNFYLVGSNDNQVLGASIAQRQIYDAIEAPNQYLLIIKGADHMALGGQRFGPDLPGDAADHALVQTATLAFWDAQLKNNNAAKSWLQNDFKNQLNDGSEFESK